MRMVNLKKPHTIFPFCECTEGARMELVRIHNSLKEHAVVEIEDTRIRFGIPAGGNRYCVFCGFEFVIALPAVICGNDYAIIRSKNRVYEMQAGKSYAVCPPEEKEPIQKGVLTLHRSGNVEYDGYVFSLSEKGNPIVYVRDSIGIDAEGYLVGKQPDRFAPEYWRRLIAAEGEGHFCITDKREVIHSSCGFCWGEEPAIDLCSCGGCYLVLAKSGTVYMFYKNPAWSPYEDDEENSLPSYLWKVLEENVTGISAHGHTAALACDQSVKIYQYDDKAEMLAHQTTICKDRFICEVGVTDENLIIKYLDDSYRFINWHNGSFCESVDGTHLFPPKKGV